MNSIFALWHWDMVPDECGDVGRRNHRIPRFEIEDGANHSHVQGMRVRRWWDTSIAMVALWNKRFARRSSGAVKAARVVLSKQVLGPGDWQIRIKDSEPGGWAFEFRNDF